MRRPDFTAATWNVGGGEPTPPTTREIGNRCRAIKDAGASVLLLQEAQQKEIDGTLRDLGYGIHRHGRECLVAWALDDWTAAARLDETLSDTPYFRKGGHQPILVESPRVILCDDRGRSLDTLSYHLASNVQRPNPPDRRLISTREAVEWMAGEAEASECRAVLFGGDDNVDERNGYGEWEFMLRAETGLRLVRAPHPTLGKRWVDDFRVTGLRPGDGDMIRTDQDHDIHLREFKFREAA